LYLNIIYNKSTQRLQISADGETVEMKELPTNPFSVAEIMGNLTLAE